MNLSDTEGKSASGAVLFIACRLVSYQHMLSVCVDPVRCTNLRGALPAKGLQALTSSGFSVSAYAAVVTIFFAITAAIWYAAGFLIFWRRSDDWLALLAAFSLVMFNVTSLGSTAS